MVNIDFLQFRKNKVRQPMQYAWCAATTRNFLGINANKISRKELVDLDIGSLCDDIMSEMSDSQEGMRCTLYLSTMLTSGAVKLFQEQTTFFLKDCEKLMLNLLGGQYHAEQKKKKKTKGQQIPEIPPDKYISLTPLSTPKFDPVKTFAKKNVEDRHLLSEIDFIEIPEPNQSFGFNPNERELTDRDIAQFYREMMGENTRSFIREDGPQDNEVFEVNQEPMHQESTVNSIEIQLSPSHGPQPELEMMKTPKRSTRSGKPKQRPSISSESAKTAYSPPKKRSRIAAYMSNDDDDNMKIAAEPTREPSLPSEVPLDAGFVGSPIFDFAKRNRRHNISLRNLEHIKKKAKEVAMMLDEPMLDAPYVQHESPPHVEPVDDAHVGLPEVSLHEPPPASAQPEDNGQAHSPNVPFHTLAMAAAQPNANDSARVFLIPSPKISASDLTLGSLRSFEENFRKKYIKRGKKIFADRIKQIEIERRSPKFMIMSRDEMLFIQALRRESVDSLFNHPITLKREMFLPEYRHWSDKLLDNYYKATTALILAGPQRAPTQKRKKRGKEIRESSQQNREAPIENMEIVPEQAQPSSPKNIDTNDQPVIKIPEHSADLIPEDNSVNVQTFEPPVDMAPVDMQTENPNNQIINGEALDVVHKPPPIVEQITEEPPLQEVTDQVEVVMSPTKRFKRRDDRELQNMEGRSKKNLTTDELFDIIQSFWNKLTRKDIQQLGFVSVEFTKVIRPDYYSLVEAGRYLYHCFLLENKKKLYLQQKIPYDTIYLIKW